MNKHIARAFIISAIIGFAVSSCELLGDCKTCSKVTYINGAQTNKTPGIVYCGDKLADKENEAPVTIGSTTTQWECD